MVAHVLEMTRRCVPAVLAPCLALAAPGCAGVDRSPETSSDAQVLPATAVDWGALNPARGAAGPRAADLWGDRSTSNATGFLVRFAPGFSSPPHIHNTTYRGIVIEGQVHNDDPAAEPSWMGPGSYWTQPAGEVHITSAQDKGGLAYIEIQHGPYLVMPPEEASDNGERAINVHAPNLVWIDASTSRRIVLQGGMDAADGPRIAFLWGDPQSDDPSGSLVAIPGGLRVAIESAGPQLQLVVVKGQPALIQSGSPQPAPLPPGSYAGAAGNEQPRLALESKDESWLYVRCSGALELRSTPLR